MPRKPQYVTLSPHVVIQKSDPYYAPMVKALNSLLSANSGYKSLLNSGNINTEEWVWDLACHGAAGNHVCNPLFMSDIIPGANNTPPSDIFVIGAVADPAGFAVGKAVSSGSAAGDSGAIAGVETPYGPASQGTSAEALAARGQVEAGAPLYRLGTLGMSQAAEAQFWALEHPATPGYAARYGIPPENVANADFIEQGRLVDGTPFVTRTAPAVGTNPGGGIEVVVPPGGVDLNWFSIVDAEG